MTQHDDLTGLPERLGLREVSVLLRVPLREVLLAVLQGSLPWGLYGLRPVVPTAELLAGFGLTPEILEARHVHDS